MKTKILLTLLTLIFTAVHVYGQAHDNSKGGCKLAKNHISTGYTCPACVANDKKVQAARDAEAKRKNDAIIAKANALEKERQIAFKKFMAERKANDKVTEVYVTMPSASSSSTESSSSSSASSANSSSSEASSSNNSTSSSESSSSESTSSSNVTTYNNVFAAENARKFNQQKAITDAAKLMGDFFDNWQANREIKWAKEKQAEENHKERINQDQSAYSGFVAKQTVGIFKNVNTYQAMMKTLLPKVLHSKSITWEDIIGAPDFNHLFGKDIRSVSKKLNLTLPKDKAQSAGENLPTDYLPKHFTHENFYTAYGKHEFFYWVKTDFYHHDCTYIFNRNDLLIGIKIKLHTSSYPDKAFPSSLQEYISVKDYYDDLIKNTTGTYFLADGTTLITRDKVFMLDFKYLTIYDLNFFDANTSFNLPSEFSQFFNPQNCGNCNSKLGIKFQGFRADETKKLAKVRITEVTKDSAAEKAGLLPGDIILNINDVVVDFPFHLQWYFLAFPDERNINLKIERAKKTENISLKL
jgi:hypothetical protein